MRLPMFICSDSNFSTREFRANHFANVHGDHAILVGVKPLIARRLIDLDPISGGLNDFELTLKVFVLSASNRQPGFGDLTDVTLFLKRSIQLWSFRHPHQICRQCSQDVSQDCGTERLHWDDDRSSLGAFDISLRRD